MNKGSHQSGFTLVEGLLIVLILSVLSFAGYYVWQNQNSDSKDNAVSTGKSTKTESTKENDETASWLSYTSPSEKFTLRIPDGWTLTRYDMSDSLYSTTKNNIVFSKGKIATVTQVEGGRDFSEIPFALNYGENSDAYLPEGAEKQKTFKTKQGEEIVRYYFVQTKEPEGLELPMGTQEYVYILQKDDKFIRVVHDIVPGDANQTTMIEKALVTLEIK